MTDISALIAHIGSEPVVVNAAARELRRLMTDPNIHIEPIGDQMSRVSRRTPITTPTLIVEECPQPASRPHGKSEVREMLEELPLGSDLSLFIPFRTGSNLSAVLHRIKSRHGYRYRTHETVREGVQGVRLWRIS